MVLRSYDDNDGPCVRVSTHDILYIYFIVLHYCKLYLLYNLHLKVLHFALMFPADNFSFPVLIFYVKFSSNLHFIKLIIIKLSA